MRSRIELTEKEDKVLGLIVQKKTTLQISKITQIPSGTINGYRRKIKEKFGAKSNLHLIVLAILQYRFYKLLGEIEFKKYQITERETKVLFHFLKGFSSQEIAASFRVSVRSVEYTRQKFLLDTRSHGDAGFVKSCLEIGLLTLLPVRFNFKEYFILGKNINIYKLKKADVKIPIYTKQMNPSGFVYLDFENRFVFECIGDYKNERKVAESISTALFLSGFSEENVGSQLSSTTVPIEEIVKSVAMNIDLTSHEEFVNFYKKRGQLVPILDHEAISNVLTAGQIILVDLIAKGKSQAEIYKQMRSNNEYIDEHINLILEMWNSTTILGVYITFIHLNFIPRKKL